MLYFYTKWSEKSKQIWRQPGLFYKCNFFDKKKHWELANIGQAHIFMVWYFCEKGSLQRNSMAAIPKIHTNISIGVSSQEPGLTNLFTKSFFWQDGESGREFLSEGNYSNKRCQQFMSQKVQAFYEDLIVRIKLLP